MDTRSRILSILNEKEVDEETIEEVENEFDEIEEEEKEKEIKNKKKAKNEEDKKEDKEAENKKAKNEDEEEKEKDEKEVEKVEKDVKEDVDNKCKNSVYNATDYFNKVNEIYNSSCQAGVQTKYETQADRLEAGNKF